MVAPKGQETHKPGKGWIRGKQKSLMMVSEVGLTGKTTNTELLARTLYEVDQVKQNNQEDRQAERERERDGMDFDSAMTKQS